jgi:hypothetical protein
MPDELERIQAALHAAGVEVACSACGGTSSTIDVDRPVGLLPIEGDELVIGDRAIKAVSVICTNCGLIRLHKTSYLLD